MSGVDDSGRPDASGLPADRSRGMWHISDVGLEDPPEPGRPVAALVSFHYLRAAVRRRWFRCLLPAIIGLLLAVGFLARSSPTATTRLLLTHNVKNDASNPMATDASLLTTREVASRTVRALGLTMTPEDLLSSVNVVPSESTDVMQLTMTGPTPAEAVRRLTAFSHEYLDFRATQILAQSTAMIEGYTSRINDLQKQVDGFNTRIQQLGKHGGTATTDLADAVAARSKLNDEISGLQSQEQDATLQQNAVKVASRVIDPPAAMSTGGRRHAALVLASGLIAGLALGLGFTVLQAILSDRLWLRTEVASALKTTVPLSVRRLAPPRLRLLAPLSFLPWIGARLARRSADRQLMGHAIAKAVPEPGRRQSVAILCLGNARELAFGAVAAASELRRRGAGSTIIDLTVSGRVHKAVGKGTETGPEERPEVFRPIVVPSLTRGPSDLETADWDDVAVAKAKNGVTLVVADFDPAVGVDYLTAWSDRVIVAVTAGESSAELVRTAGELVRVAGLHLQHAVLLGGRGDDISSGFTTLPEQDVAKTSSPGRQESDAAAGRSRVQ